MFVTSKFRSHYMRLLPVAALSIAATACSTTPPTLGDQALSQSKETADLGKEWNRGNEMIEDGQKLIKKGENQVEDGQDNIEKGKKLISNGKALVAETETQIKARMLPAAADAPAN